MSSTNSTPDAAVSTGRRILVVEDEFLIRLTLSEVLADEGYEVLEAESGDEAIAILDTSPDVAVLLTDIQLPGALDGRALVRRARETRPMLPVIFMSGRPDDSEPNATGAKEMNISKPYLPSEICAAVRKMLAD
ncbi:response regulator [Acidisphaera sp. L21]|uniref:response regulator n=1 Tax=Acidisphaera sp. L21 TaxID=1641851 RepID=UPI00131D107F|nr:response regulator [Acidisphaera sp. L21]